MAGITGIGSGIDIDTLVSGLVTAEQAPKKAALDRLESATTSKVSALGQLKSALSTFQTAITALNSPTLFEKRSATSSDTSLVTATTTSSAQTGSYALKVSQLATASQTVTAPVAAATTFASGTLTVHLGAADTGTSVNIANGATLEEVRDALNESLADTGITASLITNPGDGSTRLVMTSTEMGEDKDVYITATGGVSALAIGDASTSTLGAANDTTAGFLQEAKDAAFSINGLSMTSSTNAVSGAIEGVTFNLVAADASKTATISVAQDKSGVTANIKKFVDAYNALISTTSSLTAVVSVGDGEAPVTGGLVGDSSVRNLLSGIRRELSSPVSEGSIKMLTDLGITTKKDGTLSTDSTALAEALDENFDAVGAYFTGDTGLMSRLDDRIGAYADTDGILDERVSALKKTLNSVDDQRDALALRMEKVQTRLYAQFNAMDTLVAQLTSTSDWLTSAFENLPGSSSSN